MFVSYKRRGGVCMQVEIVLFIYCILFLPSLLLVFNLAMQLTFICAMRTYLS